MSDPLDSTPEGSDARDAAEQIPLRRNVAVIEADTITVRPARSQLLVPLIQLLIAAGALALIVLFLDSLPLLLLALLLAIAVLLGPVAALSLVFSAIGSHFVVERAKGTSRWQQGFLGLGIGTTEVVPFERVDHVEVRGDYEEELSFGVLQDIVQWDVRVVKDNERRLDVGTVAAPRPLADLGLERANRLAAAIAEMCGVDVRLAELPPDATDDDDGDEHGIERRARRMRRVDAGARRRPTPPRDGTTSTTDPEALVASVKGADPATLIGDAQTVAVVANSSDLSRPWHMVASYLVDTGFRVYLVNPALDGEVLGRRSYARVCDLPEPVDIVDIFRHADEVGPVVDDAIEAGARAVWMQLKIVDDAAAARAQEAGLDVVMDRCTKIEHQRLAASGARAGAFRPQRDA